MAVVVSGDAERRVRVAEVALRCLLCALGAAAAALVATDAQTRTFFSLQKRATYKDMRALVFLVAANAAAAGYTLLLQAARWLCACTRTTSSSAVRNSKAKKALAWSVFSCDQALAYALLAAAAAAMQASVLSKRGLPAFQWMDVCGLYGAFCRQAGAGVASAVAAVLAAVAIASLSAFNLFRLYGGGAGAATTW